MYSARDWQVREMRIVFINSSLRPDAKRRQLPVGLAYIMTAVKRAGFEFDLIDMDINNLSMQDLEDMLGKTMYDVYAFGCIVTGFRFVRQIAEIVKTVNPVSTVIAGNSVATSVPDILLQNTKVDIAVMGEGDVTIVELLKAIENGKNIEEVQGIAFNRNGKIVYTLKRSVMPKLDDIGFPDWELFDLDKYYEYSTANVNVFSRDNVISFPLNSARGCPYRCTFCYHVFKGEKYRKYSAGKIVEEINRLHNKYNCDFISFWDELTFPSIKSVELLVDKLNGLDFQFSWDAPVRGDLLKMEHVGLIRELKNVGCDNLAFSLESASPEILIAMNKKLHVSQFVEQAKALWEGGVTPLTSIVFGYPQETPETIKRTLDVCEECNIYPSVGFLLPLPGTPIYEWAKDKGHINDEIEYLSRIGDRQDFHINLTSMSDDEFVDLVTNGLQELARKLGLQLESVYKTGTYKAPEKR